MYQFDILPLLRVIYRSRLKIILITLLFLVAGVIAAHMRTLSYESHTLILPPSEKDLKGFILAQVPINRSETAEIFDLLSFNSIFQKYKMNLASRVSQSDFLESHLSIFPQNLNYELSYSATSADGFSNRVRGRNFAELASEWRLANTKLFHFPKAGYGDPTVSFRVESDHTASRQHLVLAVSYQDPKVAAEIANKYVQFVNDQTTAEVKELLIAGIDIRIKNVEDMIKHQRKIAHRRLDSHVVALNEAISISRSLGIEDPTPSFGDFNVINITPPPRFFENPATEPTPYSPGSAQRYLPLYHPGNLPQYDAGSDLILSGPPLYARGWKALQYERDALTRRTSSDFLLPSIGHLQAQLEWLKAIDPATVVFNAGQTALIALPSTTARELSNPLVALLFGSVGFLLAVFWSALRSH